MDIIEFSKKLGNFKKNLPDANHGFNKRLGREFVELARPRTPVDTGLSRESWWFEHSPEEVTVRNTAERNGAAYASFWNHGTSRQTGTRTMQIVANMIKQKRQEMHDEEIKRAWEDA